MPTLGFTNTVPGQWAPVRNSKLKYEHPGIVIMINPFAFSSGSVLSANSAMAGLIAPLAADLPGPFTICTDRPYIADWPAPALDYGCLAPHQWAVESFHSNHLLTSESSNHGYEPGGAFKDPAEYSDLVGQPVSVGGGYRRDYCIPPTKNGKQPIVDASRFPTYCAPDEKQHDSDNLCLPRCVDDCSDSITGG